MALTRYGELRNQLMRQSPGVFAPAVLRDADSNYVPIPISERLVQCIWFDQRITTTGMVTVDGRPLRVVFPGWWNLEAGPDFRHATVQIGDGEEVTGDVEVHLRADDWIHHGHQRDPQFDNVVLHVVLWKAGSEFAPKTRFGDEIPQIVLQHQLSLPLETLYDEIDVEAYPHNASGHAGQCARVLKALDARDVIALLDEAGKERFAQKIRKFARWIHRAGCEQAFYEGWMEALGYKSNKSAFRTLAQQLPLSVLKEYPRLLAPVLFGVANFLPTSAPKSRDGVSLDYVRGLWNAWWKCRPDLADKVMQTELWRMHGVRPANHPHRRLGAAAALLKKHPNLMERVVGSVESDGNPSKLFLDVRDDYWGRHFTLGGKTQVRAIELVGASRANEIVTNVVLPFVAAYAQDEGNEKLLRSTASRFANLPAAPSNSVVRLASHQLFDSLPRAREFIKTTRQQQGLMQIFQDFCLNDKSACRQCQFPELARRWSNGSVPSK